MRALALATLLVGCDRASPSITPEPAPAPAEAPRVEAPLEPVTTPVEPALELGAGVHRIAAVAPAIEAAARAAVRTARADVTRHCGDTPSDTLPEPCIAAHFRRLDAIVVLATTLCDGWDPSRARALARYPDLRAEIEANDRALDAAWDPDATASCLAAGRDPDDCAALPDEPPERLTRRNAELEDETERVVADLAPETLQALCAPGDPELAFAWW